ncbi:YslB family protein [Loigolactobacillus iwatensis]|uniref:YslB family protein n=1 Tax=Loigolactobacillus iwatensis TaxID=1267156 RepID=UPI000F7DA171|nr:YslB family protein [Loigolactobacillus iwatensis]
MTENLYDSLIKSSTTANSLNYELLRDVLLPNLLGQESAGILYWAGKSLARQLPLADISDLSHFFSQFGLGDLTLTEQGHRQYHFTLAGPVIEKRQAAFAKADFQLETGFIAQQIQQITAVVAEGQQEIGQGLVTITIATDTTDTPLTTQTAEPLTFSKDDSEPIESAPEITKVEPNIETTTTKSDNNTEPRAGFIPSRRDDHKKRHWFGSHH